MRRLVFVLALRAAGASVAAVTADQQVFRGRLDTVPVYTTVTDKAGRLVTDLTREDFQVFDNGKAQPLTLFDNSPQPIRLIVMLDVSGSMAGNLRLIRRACEQLFKRLRAERPGARRHLRQRNQDQPDVHAATRAILRASVPTSIAPTAPTPLWRALDQAMTAFAEVQRAARHSRPQRRQGQPRLASRQEVLSTRLDIIDRAQREDVMIYGIGLRGACAGAIRSRPAAMMDVDCPIPGSARLAADTGGGYFEIRPRDDLGAAFAQVADELHRQYLLGFVAPAADGKMHKLEVKMTKQESSRARARPIKPPRPADKKRAKSASRSADHAKLTKATKLTKVLAQVFQGKIFQKRSSKEFLRVLRELRGLRVVCAFGRVF